MPAAQISSTAPGAVLAKDKKQRDTSPQSADGVFMQSLEEDILRSLRQISRAIDLHSRQLSATYGLTGPQLICLRVVGRHQEITPSALAREVSLSQPTITGIVDRLVARQLIKRRRPKRDRRTVAVALTPAGAALIADAPSPLQEKFAQRLALLPEEERESVRSVLARVVRMMDGEDLDVPPLLESTPLP